MANTSTSRFILQGWFLCDFRSAVTLVALYLFMAIFGPNIAANIPIINAYPMKFCTMHLRYFCARTCQ